MTHQVWCHCYLPLDGVQLWLEETGGAVLQHQFQCGLCYRPRLTLLPQDHQGYLVHVDDHVFESWLSLDGPNIDLWLQDVAHNRWAASQMLGYPFRCLSFNVHSPTNRVTCAVAEIYSDFETALAIGRSRQWLSVFDLSAQRAINIS